MTNQTLPPSFPPSIPIKNQVKTLERRPFPWDNHTKAHITPTLRYDDQCNNGHNTFSITADIVTDDRRHRDRTLACGCLHEEIAKTFPELEPYIKWHGCTSEGPLHYISNTCYHVGDKDHWGGRKGEVRAYRYNVAVEVLRTHSHLIKRAPDVEQGLVFDPDTSPYRLPNKKDAEDMAYRIGGEIVPVPWLYHEGKDRDLAAARHCAIWPDAADEDLTAPGLEDRLMARLPALMLDFKAAMESLGFIY